jgi:gamma-glutamylcyclotransferase (GGCT)/AIG2-like uncharacterized protein YtfP
VARDDRRTLPATVVDRMFVYGSLRTGQSARDVIAPFVVGSEAATVRGSLYAFPSGYPGVVPDDGGAVVGEVLRLRELAAAFPLLDAFEGEDFIRVMVEATTATGPQWVWLYALTSPELAHHGVRIEHGDWSRYRAETG